MAELGTYSLLIAFVLTLVGLVAGVVAGLRKDESWSQVAQRSVIAVFAMCSVAIAALFYAFATFDFQIQYVASHSARSMALHYRLAALWGGQAGSLLLWLWMLSAYSAACVFFQRRTSSSLMPWVCAVLLVNMLFFLVLLNFVEISKPFLQLPPERVVSDGNGLNPLLQHPVMMIHPLMLYTGFVGFAVPFAFATAALCTGELGASWLRATRRWTLFAWFFLSIGILLGGRWAYEVLGWGGYWAWDPVENASFMPWLPATAYLHSVMIQEKRDMLKTWNLVLVGLTYSLCLFGTFLTRSGVVQSVHSFTQSGWFGTLFLVYVLVLAAIFFTLLTIRALQKDSPLRTSNRLESVLSRETGFVLNNWAFIALLVIVFTLTMFPVFSEWFTDEKIAPRQMFFNWFSAPIAVFLLFLTGVGPLIAWRRASWTSLRRQFVLPAAVGVIAAVVLAVALGDSISWYPLTSGSLCCFVIATIGQEYFRAVRARMRRGEGVFRAFGTLLVKNQRRYGGYVVHLGFVFIMVGIAGAVFSETRLESIRPGDSLQMNGYRLEYLTAKPLPAQHYGGAVARLALYQADRPLVTMTPEKRMYWLEQQPASIPSIYSTIGEDLYVILTAIELDGSATLKLYRNPLVNWLWIGGYTFVLGAVIVIWPHSPRRKPE